MLGYGLILIEGQKTKCIEMDVLQVPVKLDAYQRLELIYFTVQQVILKFRPDDFAIEAPFFGKNVQSMLKLGRAQGVAMAAALNFDVPIFEYSPKKIKLSITGNGNAAKEQVAAMLQQILKFTNTNKHLDATDALAVAVCHHFQGKSQNATGKKTYKNWGAFLTDNPDRKG